MHSELLIPNLVNNNPYNPNSPNNPKLNYHVIGASFSEMENVKGYQDINLDHPNHPNHPQVTIVFVGPQCPEIPTGQANHPKDSIDSNDSANPILVTVCAAYESYRS